MIIMGVLLAMTLGFGSGRVKDLDRQSVSDQFVDGFHTLVGQSRTSSYLYGQKYNQLLVHFGSGDHGLITHFSGSTIVLTGFTSWVFVLDHMVSNAAVVSSIDVELTPYAIWCQIRAGNTMLSWATIWTHISWQEYCYHLESSLCTLKKIACSQ